MRQKKEKKHAICKESVIEIAGGRRGPAVHQQQEEEKLLAHHHVFSKVVLIQAKIVRKVQS